MEREWRNNGGMTPIRSLSPPLPPSFPPVAGGGSVGVTAGGGGGGDGVGYIEHAVSKLDTLAGVAIKYGVEVADIKRINGLVTDLQMFALKTLQIPLPGRHPPSPVLSNAFDAQGPSTSEQTPPSHVQSDLFDSFQSLKLKKIPQRRVSPAMNSLQGYYGLKPTDQKAESEGFEMAVYRNGGAYYLEDGSFDKPSSLPNQPLRGHRKSRSFVNGCMLENGDLSDDVSFAEGDSDGWVEKLVRSRQKSEAGFGSRTPEMLLREDTGNSGFSAITGKGLAQRPKAASRIVSGPDAEAGWQNHISTGLGDSPIAESINGVRKSSSTSSLQDSDNSSSSSLWPTSKWSLKPDLQSLSTAAITKPIFDGLPRPVTGRRSKAARD